MKTANFKKHKAMLEPTFIAVDMQNDFTGLKI